MGPQLQGEVPELKPGTGRTGASWTDGLTRILLNFKVIIPNPDLFFRHICFKDNFSKATFP